MYSLSFVSYFFKEGLDIIEFSFVQIGGKMFVISKINS